MSLADLAKNLEDDKLGDLVVGSLRVPARGAFRRCPPLRLSGRDATEFGASCDPLATEYKRLRVRTFLHLVRTLPTF